MDFLSHKLNFLLGVTTEMLRANIDGKSAFSNGVSQFRPKFKVEEEVDHKPFLYG